MVRDEILQLLPLMHDAAPLHLFAFLQLIIHVFLLVQFGVLVLLLACVSKLCVDIYICFRVHFVAADMKARHRHRGQRHKDTRGRRGKRRRGENNAGERQSVCNRVTSQ